MGGQLADHEEISDECDHLCFCLKKIADTTFNKVLFLSTITSLFGLVGNSHNSAAAVYVLVACFTLKTAVLFDSYCTPLCIKDL